MMHSCPIVYTKRKNLKRHLYFVHRGDSIDSLAMHGFNPQLIEEKSKECRHKHFEYEWARVDFERFCCTHEQDTIPFELFTELNKKYEDEWVNKQMRKYLIDTQIYNDSIIPYFDDDDDNY